MSDPIELSHKEVDAAASTVDVGPGGMGFEDRRRLVEKIVRTVNSVRAGDPVGTIRRADTGVVALLTGVDPAAPWTVFSPCGNPLGQWTQEIISLWPVIYTPEEES